MAKPTGGISYSKQAADWFKARVPLTKEELQDIDRRARSRAFTVANVSQAKLVNDVHRELERAIKKGTTLADFKRSVGAKLEAEWGGTVTNPSARMDTIFRTNMQSAYMAGRMREIRDPDTIAVRPFWLFSGIADRRQSDICKVPVDGTVLPAEHKWWSTHTPPLHFNCRSTIRPLSEAEAEERGLTKIPSRVKADEGFGSLEDLEREPDLEGVAPELKIVADAKASKRRR